ncbi:MAG TPA: hypothetical protein VFM18_08525 [Methanosarcina sp.]|nr:hypothetical protein [Methanosarcina sp.]
MIQNAPTLVNNAISAFGKKMLYKHRDTSLPDIQITVIKGSVHSKNEEEQDGLFLKRHVSFNIAKSEVQAPNIMDMIVDENGVEWTIKDMEYVEIVERFLLTVERSDLINKFRR